MTYSGKKKPRTGPKSTQGQWSEMVSIKKLSILMSELRVVGEGNWANEWHLTDG